MNLHAACVFCCYKHIAIFNNFLFAFSYFITCAFCSIVFNLVLLLFLCLLCLLRVLLFCFTFCRLVLSAVANFSAIFVLFCYCKFLFYFSLLFAVMFSFFFLQFLYFFLFFAFIPAASQILCCCRRFQFFYSCWFLVLHFACLHTQAITKSLG